LFSKNKQSKQIILAGNTTGWERRKSFRARLSVWTSNTCHRKSWK